MPDIDDLRVAQKLAADMKAEAIGVAKLRGLRLGQKQYTREEERLMFDHVADGWTVEKEQALLSGFNADGTPMLDPKTGQPVTPKSRNEVGAMKFPDRLKLAASGERALSKYAQARYLHDLAREVYPGWQPEPSPASEPPVPAPGPMPTDQAPPPEAGLFDAAPMMGGPTDGS